MCLDLYEGSHVLTPRIAEEDIVVYKLLSERNIVPDVVKRMYPYTQYFSPFQDYPYALGVEYTAELTCVLDVILGEKYGTVSTGLHSFEFESAAVQCRYVVGSVIAKARIPKGATYYHGEFGRHKSYTSDRLILDEIVS